MSSIPPASTAPSANPQINWDDSQMVTSYANICNVMGTREEIMVLFGANTAWQSDQKEVTIKLSTRVVLNPYAAKRLKNMLETGLREYEARYGELKV